MNVLFHSGRRFMVRQYSHSHRRLLLRSERQAGFPTRIDVCFEHVERMCVVPAYRELDIFIGNEEQAAKLSSSLGFPVDPKYLFFIGDSETDYVISGVPAWHEDEKSSTEPSFFGAFPGA